MHYLYEGILSVFDVLWSKTVWNKFATEAQAEQNIDNWNFHHHFPYRKELIRKLIRSEFKQQ